MNKHKARFMGSIGKVRYKYVPLSYVGFMQKHFEDEKWDLIEEVELDYPPLRVDEEVYIASLQDTFYIQKVARSTDNSFIYYTNYKIKEIEDDETIKSKEKAEKDKRDHESKDKDRKENNNNKKWYVFW